MPDDNENSSVSSAPPDVPEHIAKCLDVSTFTTFFQSEPSGLGLILKGFHAMESYLNASLIEALHESDALELSRITFTLKTDLLIALGLLPRQQKPLFERLNSYRNKFAHNPYHQIDKSYSNETLKLLCSLAPDIYKRFNEDDIDKEDLFAERMLLFVCWADCMHTLTASCKKNIAGAVSARAVETFGKSGLKYPFDDEGIGNHWKQCEAELLKERYPTFFTSLWPTHRSDDQHSA